MNLKISALGCALAIAMLSGCATQTSPLKLVEHPDTQPQQQAAQQAVVQAQPTTPTLKRKIALGRITNETTYGKSLLRTVDGDPLGKQVADMLAKALTESQHFTVLERTDLTALNKEAQLTGNGFQAIGADVLLIGSVTEFGRKTIGQSGFFSSSKRQVAYAKMDVRVVDTSNGRVLFSCSGAGEAGNEKSSIMGWGSRAGYDGTLNDKAIAQAASEIVNQLVTRLADRPWRSYFLSTDPANLAISGGAAQGLTPGMKLAVRAAGKRVQSAQTGFWIQLPGKVIATIEVLDSFGDTAETEGSLVRVTSGSIKGQKAENLIIEQIRE